MPPAETSETPVDPRRSAMMARIGSRDTVPELRVRRLLHRLGYRFRLHRRDLPGRPDVVLPGRRTIFLVHGCFWHRHPGCRFAYTPRSRAEFWERKFTSNVARDGRVTETLRELGWRVEIVWECETRNPADLEHRVHTVLASNSTVR